MSARFLDRARARLTLVGLVALVTLAGCSTATRTTRTDGMVHLTGDAGARARARADSARNPYTDGDIHFMSGMISHHAQAIVMARWAEPNGASPSVRTLAARITNAQQDEIALMQNWLKDRALPVPEAKPMPMKMKMDGVDHEMLMPGMLSDAQMQELEAARGRDFDRLFLTYMIQHHKGAVTMRASASSAGLMDAGEAVSNMKVVSPRRSRRPRASSGITNSDLAFTGNYVIQGNYNGPVVWDISNPAEAGARGRGFSLPGLAERRVGVQEPHVHVRRGEQRPRGLRPGGVPEP
jgi:uncharacterized protein (DUF305 family)